MNPFQKFKNKIKDATPQSRVYYLKLSTLVLVGCILGLLEIRGWQGLVTILGLGPLIGYLGKVLFKAEDMTRNQYIKSCMFSSFISAIWFWTLVDNAFNHNFA